MKKVFLFFVLVGLVTGLVFGIRNSLIHKQDSKITIDNDSGDVYVHELNIPIMEIDSLNPILTANKHVANILTFIYEPLVTVSKTDRLTPMLATEWAQKDELNWIVKLRKDVKWHNGTDYTATDVIFTVQSILDDAIKSIYKSNVSNINNVEEIDEYSVQFTLNYPDELFIYKLVFPIIPEYYFKNGDILNEEKNDVPVGTGAFKYVTTNIDDEYIKLEKNELWWNISDGSKLNTIYLFKYPAYGEAIKAYKSAKVDLIDTSMSDYVKKFGTIGNNIYSFESSTFDVIIPNTKRLMLSENTVRKAILYALNRENIVSKVFNSNATVADMPIHSSSDNYYSGLQADFDIDKAKQILLNGGWKNDGKSWTKTVNGTWTRLKFTILVNKENTEQVRTAEVIKENLDELNINVTIKETSLNEIKSALDKGNFDLVLTSLDIKNEFTFLDTIQSNNVYNFAKYSNEKVDEEIRNILKNISDYSLQTLEKIFKDEVPYIGICFRNNILLTNKSVKGSIEPYFNNPYGNNVTWCK